MKNPLLYAGIALLAILLYVYASTNDQTSTDDFLKFETSCDENYSCAEGACNQELQLCFREKECSLLQGNNDTGKIDILFITEGMSGPEAKKSVNTIIGNSQYQGMFNTAPFRENIERFNIWVTSSAGTGAPPDRKNTKIKASQCPHADKTITLSKEKFRSYCYFSGDCYLSLGKYPEEHWGKLFLHEFGHGFAGLADEYTEPELGDKPRSPNCAPDEKTAEEWWGKNARKYQGCSYTEDNYRPTQSSIMKSHLTQKEYGLINEEHLKKKIYLYDDATSGTGEQGLVQAILLEKNSNNTKIIDLGLRKGNMPQQTKGETIIILKDGDIPLYEARAELTTEHWYDGNNEEIVPDAGIYYKFNVAYELVILPYTSRATSIIVVENNTPVASLNISNYNKCNNICEAQEQCAKDCSINLCTEKQKEFLEISELLSSQNVHVSGDEEGFLVLEEKKGLFVETKI